MDCSPPGSSVHGISQARTLEWVAISFFQGVFLPQGLHSRLLHWQVDSLPESPGKPIRVGEWGEIETSSSQLTTPQGCKEQRQGGTSADDLYFSCFSGLSGGFGGSTWGTFSPGWSPSGLDPPGGGEGGALFAPPSKAPKADPTEPRRMLDDVESPAAPVGETEGEHRKGPVASDWDPSEGLRPRDPTWMPPLGPESPRALLWAEGARGS